MTNLATATHAGPLTMNSLIFGAVSGTGDAAPDSFVASLVYDLLKTQFDTLYPTQAELQSLDDYVRASSLLKDANNAWNGGDLTTIDFADAEDETGLVTYGQLLEVLASSGSIEIVQQPYDTVRVTSDTTAIRAVPCEIKGFSVAASSSGNIEIYANSSNTGTAIWSGAVAAGFTYEFPGGEPYISFLGLSFNLVSGTATIDIFVR
jgi:hypothetical protein